LFVLVVEIELIRERIAIESHHSRTALQGKSDAVGHTHRSDTSSVVFSTAFFHFTFMTMSCPIVASAVGITEGLLVCGNFIKNVLQAVFCNMESAFKLSSLFLPFIFLLCP
jgi:hypothetical protein